MSMHEIILALQAELDLLPRLGLQTVIDFFDLVHRLRRDIEVELSFPTNSTEAPTHLPTIACTFLKNCLGLSRRDIDKLWAVLRDLAWATPLSPSLPSKRVLDHFTHHGILLNLCMYSLDFTDGLMLTSTSSTRQAPPSNSRMYKRPVHAQAHSRHRSPSTDSWRDPQKPRGSSHEGRACARDHIFVLLSQYVGCGRC
jgi:hypothetical protein